MRAWQSHGSRLSAASKLIANRVLIVAIDESRVSASGCSIDSLTHFLKDEAQTTPIDWFNRTYILHRPHSYPPKSLNDNWSVSSQSEFHELMNSQQFGHDVELINSTVLTLDSARLNLVQKVSESWIT